MSVNIPFFFGSTLSNVVFGKFIPPLLYVGVIPLVFVYISIFQYRKNQMVKTLLNLILIYFLFILKIPYFDRIISILPGFNVAVNVMIVLIVSFVFSVLAGIGMQYILDLSSKNHREFIKRFKKIFIVNTSFVLVLVLLNVGKVIGNFYIREDLFNCSIFLLFFILAYILISKLLINEISVKHVCIAILFCTFLDMFIYSANFLPSISKKDIYPETKHIKILKEDRSIFRISASNDILIPEIGMLYNLSDIRAYDGMLLDRYAEFIGMFDPLAVAPVKRSDMRIMQSNDAYKSSLYDLLNVKYFVTDKMIVSKRYEPVFDQDDIYLYRNNSVLPRAFMVSDFEVINEGAKILSRLSDKSLNLKKTVILEKNIKGIKFNNNDISYDLTISEYRTNSVTIETKSQDNGILVLADNFFPGWRVYVDGMEGEILRSNYTFRSVVVSSGSHLIRFVYDPASYKLGLGISILSFFVLCTIFSLRHHIN